MLDIVMDVDNSTLQALTKSLQNLRMKDVVGENLGTIVIYLKGALMLLSNCGKSLTDTMGLLKDNIFSAECNKLTTFVVAPIVT